MGIESTLFFYNSQSWKKPHTSYLRRTSFIIMSKVHGWRNLLRSSHDAISLELDFIPSGVTNLLTPFGANKHAEELLAAPPRRTRSNRCGSPVRPVSPRRSGERPTNVARARSRRGNTCKVVLGSAGQLGRLQTSRR
jgi:hypothetical protein